MADRMARRRAVSSLSTIEERKLHAAQSLEDDPPCDRYLLPSPRRQSFSRLTVDLLADGKGGASLSMSIAAPRHFTDQRMKDTTRAL